MSILDVKNVEVETKEEERVRDTGWDTPDTDEKM